ncbi:MAG TPA: MmcQ/YjbR family DNA-binding protein [Candidatus Limnocylindria bacterium]|nr:MmcQ/YjbR family DNA-binding protein [Candidatus Limnocylindria bacterium]
MAGVKAAKAQLRKHALAFEGAYEDHPWGEDVAKVNGKVFAFLGVADDTSEYIVGVKLTRSLLYARSLPHVEPMGYGLGKSGWCNVKRPKGRIDMKLLKDWIAESYEAVAPARKRARPAPRRAARR